MKKRSRRLAAAGLTAALAVAMFPTAAWAATSDFTVQWSTDLTDNTMHPGDTLTLYLEVSYSEDGEDTVHGWTTSLICDADLEVVEVEPREPVDNTFHVETIDEKTGYVTVYNLWNQDYTDISDLTFSNLESNWGCAVGGKRARQSAKIKYGTWKLPETFEGDSFSINENMEWASATWYDGAKRVFDFPDNYTPWSLTVNVVHDKLGEINGDGITDSQDITVLQRYLDGWETPEGETWTVNVNTADMNGDGEINGMDVTLYRRYLDDWYVGQYSSLDELKAAQSQA